MEGIEYNLKIISLNTLDIPLNGFSDIIGEVDWELTAILKHEEKVYGATGSDKFIIDIFNLKLDKDTFIDYKELTEDIIISWIENNDLKLNKMKEDLKNYLYSAHLFPLKSSPLPWIGEENLDLEVQQFISGNLEGNGNYVERTNEITSTIFPEETSVEPVAEETPTEETAPQSEQVSETP